MNEIYVVDKGRIVSLRASSEGGREEGEELRKEVEKKGRDQSPAPKAPQRVSLQASIIIIIFLSTENLTIDVDIQEPEQ